MVTLKLTHFTFSIVKLYLVRRLKVNMIFL